MRHQKGHADEKLPKYGRSARHSGLLEAKVGQVVRGKPWPPEQSVHFDRRGHAEQQQDQSWGFLLKKAEQGDADKELDR